MSVGVSGVVIVCLLFQGGYISVNGSGWRCHRLPAVSGWIYKCQWE